MFNAIDEKRKTMEDFYDAYVVNAIMDAAYKSVESKKWEPVVLEIWRGQSEEESRSSHFREYDKDHWLIKEEKMPDGKNKLILKEKTSGKVLQRLMQ